MLVQETIRSLTCALSGLIIGTAAGYVIAIGTLLLPGWQSVPTKLIAYLRATPPLAIVFLLVFLSPSAAAAPTLYVSFCVCVLVGGTLQDSRKYLPENLMLLVEQLGGRRWHQLIDVAAPAMWIRAKETIAWITQLLLPLTFGAELISSQSRGLGGLGYQAFIYANLPQLCVLALIYVLTGHALNYTILALTRSTNSNPTQI